MLLTKELEHRFAKVGRQEDKGEDAIVIAKFFTPWTNWTWYCLEYDPEERVFFGLVDGHYVELGYFSLDELKEITGPVGLRIERDLSWKEKSLREVRAEIDRRAA